MIINIIFTICILFIFIQYKKRKDLFEIGPFFLFTNILTIYPRLFAEKASLDSVFFNPYYNLYNVDLFVLNTLVFISYFSFILGYLISNKTHRRSPIGHYQKPTFLVNRFYNVSIFFLVVNAILSYSKSFGNLVVYSSVLYSSKYFLIPLFKMYYVKVVDIVIKKKYYLFIIFALLSIIDMSKESIILFFLVVIILRHYLVTKISIFSILVGVCSVLVFVILYPVLKYGLNFNQLKLINFEDLYAILISRYYHVESFQMVINEVERSGTLYEGSFSSLFAPFIPRFLWVDKPNSIGYFFAENILDVNTSAALSLHGEVYWYWGSFGLIVFFFLLGVLLSKCYYLYIQNGKSPYDVLIYSIILFNVFMLNDGNISHRFIITILYLLPIFILKRIKTN